MNLHLFLFVAKKKGKEACPERKERKEISTFGKKAVRKHQKERESGCSGEREGFAL